MKRRAAGEEFAEDGGGTSMILCLLKGYPGATQISKVSAADGINGRDRAFIRRCPCPRRTSRSGRPPFLRRAVRLALGARRFGPRARVPGHHLHYTATVAIPPLRRPSL